MTALILHLSDIHTRATNDWIVDKAEKIAACAFPELVEAAVVFIVVSGDIAFSGKAEEYGAAREFLTRVRDAIEKEKKLPIHFVLVPGNHDCDFKLGSNARHMVLSGARADPSRIDDSVIAVGTHLQSAYREFERLMLSEDSYRSGDQIWASHEFNVEGKSIIFEAINVAWCSNLHEEPGSMIVPVDRYINKLNEPTDIRIAVLHHPLNWFSQTSYRKFRDLVRTISNVVISGHEHVGGVGEDFHSESGHSAYIEGCVLQDEDDLSNSSFNVAVLSLNDGTYRSTRYRWDSTERYAATEEGSWSDFRALPRKARNQLSLKTSFEQVLSDPGGSFQSKGSPITLADLYVYPDMQESTDERDQKKILSTSVLSEPSRIEGGVLLTGEEKVGATSLLYMLYRAFHERGFVPVYIRGTELRGASAREIEVAVQRAVVEQYGEDAIGIFQQSAGAQKVLLLDDFDDGPVKSSAHRAKLLKSLTSRFHRFVVTASELFDFEESILPHELDGLSGVKTFRILPMGYTLRANLVKRWFHRTAGDGSLDDASFLARCDQGERLLDAVMARNIVPALPLYLLTLLQSYDAGSSSGFEESGLGNF